MSWVELSRGNILVDIFWEIFHKGGKNFSREMSVGNDRQGQIVLPCRSLLKQYSRLQVSRTRNTSRNRNEYDHLLSQSASTTFGLFPPSSIVVLFKLVSAAIRLTC